MRKHTVFVFVYHRLGFSSSLGLQLSSISDGIDTQEGDRYCMYLMRHPSVLDSASFGAYGTAYHPHYVPMRGNAMMLRHSRAYLYM